MQSWWRIWGTAALALLVAGCASEPSAPPVAPVVQAAPPPPKPYLPPVSIVVSADIPAYTSVAERLQQSLGERATRYGLDAASAHALAQQPGQVVAIGLEAAVMSKPLAQQGRAVVFCQVFNYQDDDLLSPHSKGVAMLPSYRQTFAIWRELAPSVRRVAVFTGPGLESLLAPAVREAARYGITLVPASVHSDKEFIYSYKQAATYYDGLWLLPDNRVLSRNAIAELMSYSLRNGKQVVVFSDRLLPLGGLFSVASEADEIADKVRERLAAARPSGVIDGPDMVALDRAVIRINPVVARRFGLSIPERLQRYASE